MLKGKQRLDKAVIKKGTKRPSVFLAEEALKALDLYDGPIDGWAGKSVDLAIREAQRKFITPDIADDDVDGKMGRDTWTVLLRAAYPAGFKPSLLKRCQSMICYYEVGNRQNAYGAAGAIRDGAGANYGISQHNAHGSVRTILKMNGLTDLLSAYNTHNRAFKGNKWHPAGRNPAVLPELREWFNSMDGIEAQDRYFKRLVFDNALKVLAELEVFDDYKDDPKLDQFYERAVALLCDSMIQNGALFSPNAKPFWRSLTASERRVPRYVELHEGNRWDEKLTFHLPYERMKTRWSEIEEVNRGIHTNPKKVRRETNREAMKEFVKLVRDPELQLFIVGQMRARSSTPRWWSDVEARRMVSALGVGTVHGEHHNIQLDWGIGIESDTFDDHGEDFREVFTKANDELFSELKAEE